MAVDVRAALSIGERGREDSGLVPALDDVGHPPLVERVEEFNRTLR